MTRKNPTARADKIEAAEGTWSQAYTDAGNEYRENLALGMPQAEAEAIWKERHAEADAARAFELDTLDLS